MLMIDDLSALHADGLLQVLSKSPFKYFENFGDPVFWCAHQYLQNSLMILVTALSRSAGMAAEPADPVGENLPLLSDTLKLRCCTAHPPTTFQSRLHEVFNK